MNEFFIQFLSHAKKDDADWIGLRQSYGEHALSMTPHVETTGVFYPDEPHGLAPPSYSATMLWGHQWSVLTLDFFVLTTVDWFVGDEIIACCFAAVVHYIVASFKQHTASQTISRTGGVEQKFLI